MRNMCLLKSRPALKRAAALALALCLALPFAGCKSEPKLEDYANAVGGYAFSYPENWEVYSVGGDTSVSIADVGGALPYAMVRFSAFDNAGGLTAAEYWDEGRAGFFAVYDSAATVRDKCGAFEKEGVNSAYGAVLEVSLKGETRLDGQPSKAGEAADYTVRQLVFENGGRICVVSYLSSRANYEIYGGVMDDIRDSFEFTEPVPEGAAEDRGFTEFNMPVPEGWTLDTAEAYYKLSLGRATVVACVFSLDRDVSARQYWEETYKPSIRNGIADFKEISDEDCKLGAANAVDARYTGCSVSGAVYSFRQRLAVWGGQVYIITLTASGEDYEAANAGYEEMIAGFSFK